ncbi:MAG: acyl-CoA carboxylase subunit beta [Planctomycetota bacterium]|nr:MAG: acyl-CoA carboxylase subunit beta [Planctomycetota bacterium]
MRERVAELERRRARAEAMGGPERVAAQHAQGKRTARERVALLCDEGSFLEIGKLARHLPNPLLRGKETPADGVVVGIGRVEGRPVGVAAYDFTVLAGSIGTVGEVKVTRLRELCLRERFPIVWLIDSAGARIQEAAGSQFAGSGWLFREQAILSGVVPQVAALMGPGIAGTAYIPGLADVVFMVRGVGAMALAGPPLVKAAVGEEVSEQELGGSAVHTRESGCAHAEFPDDESCIQAIRSYLGYFPSRAGEKPPRRPCDDPPDRREERLLDIVPDDVRYGFDMNEVIECIVDHGEHFPIHAEFGKALLCSLARLDGRPVGIVASNSRHAGGALDNDAADKAAHFITLCDAFELPLVFLQDVPGFWVGSRVERAGIIRHGAKMLYAVSQATVPKLTVLVRKAYGAGYYVMCGRAYEPDLIVAWPSAECSLMGAEGAVNIIHGKAIAAADDPAAARRDLVKQFKTFIDPWKPAEQGLIDDVIDPRETRAVLCQALAYTEHKTVERPARKTGVWPV